MAYPFWSFPSLQEQQTNPSPITASSSTRQYLPTSRLTFPIQNPPSQQEPSRSIPTLSPRGPLTVEKKCLKSKARALRVLWSASAVLICNSNGEGSNIMLTEDLIQQTANNRRCEKTTLPVNALLHSLALPAYQSLIEWVFEISNDMGLLTNTKFLARNYFDLTLHANQDLDLSSYLPLFLACLSLAIKFNERRQVSERLTPEVLFGSAQQAITASAYFQLERRVLAAIRFRFRVTSPLDYLEGYLARFPFLPRLRNILPTIIEFALIHPQACEFSSEEIFYGAVLSQLGRVELTDFQRNVLGGLTDCWGRAKVMGEMIAGSVRKYAVRQPCI